MSYRGDRPVQHLYIIRYYCTVYTMLVHTFSVLSLQLKKLQVTQQVSQTYQMSIPLVVTKRYEGQRVASW